MRTQTACGHMRFAMFVNHVYRPAAVEGARDHSNPCFCALRGHRAAWGWRPRRSRGVHEVCRVRGAAGHQWSSLRVPENAASWCRAAAVRRRERGCGRKSVTAGDRHVGALPVSGASTGVLRVICSYVRLGPKPPFCIFSERHRMDGTTGERTEPWATSAR